jgi:uncharacterized UBP type Zn finger protein
MTVSSNFWIYLLDCWIDWSGGRWLLVHCSNLGCLFYAVFGNESNTDALSFYVPFSNKLAVIFAHLTGLLAG